jgi:hypothetical protein
MGKSYRKVYSVYQRVVQSARPPIRNQVPDMSGGPIQFEKEMVRS